MPPSLDSQISFVLLHFCPAAWESGDLAVHPAPENPSNTAHQIAILSLAKQGNNGEAHTEHPGAHFQLQGPIARMVSIAISPFLQTKAPLPPLRQQLTTLTTKNQKRDINSQRDELSAKGKSNKGQDLVALRVFKGEKSPFANVKLSSKSTAQASNNQKAVSKSPSQPNLTCKRISPKAFCFSRPPSQRGVSKFATSSKSKVHSLQSRHYRSSESVRKLHNSIHTKNRTLGGERGVKLDQAIESGKSFQRPDRPSGDKSGAAEPKEKLLEKKNNPPLKNSEKKATPAEEKPTIAQRQQREGNTTSKGALSFGQEKGAALPLSRAPARHDQLLPGTIGAETARAVQQRNDKRGKATKANSLASQEYKLGDLLYMISLAVNEGAITFDELIKTIEGKALWLKKALGLSNGLPPRQLFWALLTALDPESFDRSVFFWLEELKGKKSPYWPQSKAPFLPHIDVWLSPLGILFGQKLSNSGSRESDAVKKLLTALDLSKGLLMSSALDSQELIAQTAEAKRGLYIAEVENPLSELPTRGRGEKVESYIEGKERICLEVWPLSPQEKASDPAWRQSVANECQLDIESYSSNGKEYQTRHLVTNLEDPSKELFDMLRLQLLVEKKVYWLLNFSFHSPAAQNCQRNLALIASHGNRQIHL